MKVRSLSLLGHGRKYAFLLRVLGAMDGVRQAVAVVRLAFLGG